MCHFDKGKYVSKEDPYSSHENTTRNQLTVMCTTRGEHRLIEESMFAYTNFIEN